MSQLVAGKIRRPRRLGGSCGATLATNEAPSLLDARNTSNCGPEAEQHRKGKPCLGGRQERTHRSGPEMTSAGCCTPSCEYHLARYARLWRPPPCLFSPGCRRTSLECGGVIFGVLGHVSQKAHVPRCNNMCVRCALAGCDYDSSPSPYIEPITGSWQQDAVRVQLFQACLTSLTTTAAKNFERQCQPRVGRPHKDAKDSDNFVLDPTNPKPKQRNFL